MVFTREVDYTVNVSKISNVQEIVNISIVIQKSVKNAVSQLTIRKVTIKKNTESHASHVKIHSEHLVKHPSTKKCKWYPEHL